MLVKLQHKKKSKQQYYTINKKARDLFLNISSKIYKLRKKRYRIATVFFFMFIKTEDTNTNTTNTSIIF